MNPQVVGLRGIWHPKRSYGYVTGRTGPPLAYPTSSDPDNPDPVNVATDIQHDGAYDRYNPFWIWDNTHWDKDETDWQWASEVTQFTPYNFDVENRSPLDIYSSAVYGYDYKLPVAVAGNAEMSQVTSVDFESKTDVASLCRARFLIGNGDVDPVLVNEAHSGKQSMALTSESSISAFHILQPPTEVNEDCEQISPGLQTNPLFNRVREQDCMSRFAPSADNYLLSVWVKTSAYDNYAASVKPTDYEKIGIEVYINGTAARYDDGSQILPPMQESRSTIIDGWQRVDYRFTVSMNDVIYNQGQPDIEIKFVNNDTDPDVVGYFDDLRIHPEDASMVSYVYDPIALRLVAQGDERNYYTFYTYRPDGGLTGVLRETERGKQSLNYNEANASKINP